CASATRPSDSPPPPDLAGFIAQGPKADGDDLGVAVDAAIVVDLAAPKDFAAPPDLATPVDLSMPVAPGTCGEASCSPVTAAYISHFTGAGCTGVEHYFTPYYSYDGVRRSWDGHGLAGTALQTVTHLSYKDASGTCFDAWPGGDTQINFV